MIHLINIIEYNNWTEALMNQKNKIRNKKENSN